MQLVFALEKASVAAVNKDTSIAFEDTDFAGCTGVSTLDVLEGISFGSSVDVMGPCSPVSPRSGLGEGGGVGNSPDFSGEVL